MTPFVGENFNLTRAGIHADGLLKNEEIYNIFDTEKYLNRVPEVSISNTSGLAGIARWINTHYAIPKDKQVDKHTRIVAEMKEAVDREYEDGRVTVLTNSELRRMTEAECAKLGVTIDELEEMGSALFPEPVEEEKKPKTLYHRA